MARPGAGSVLRLSILDRLTAPTPGRSDAALQGIGVRELKQEVARDLEWLLNTRTWLSPEQNALEGLEEARESLLTYGIPDLSTYSWANPQDCQRIANLVETAIRVFEPRLLARSVRCEIVPNEHEADFDLKLRIEAILHVDPISEHVSFDGTAEFDGGGIRIESFE